MNTYDCLLLAGLLLPALGRSATESSDRIGDRELMTRGRRIAMACAYMPIGSTFNGQQNVLPDSYFKALNEGDVLENDEWNPVVYQNTVPAGA